MLVLNVYYEVKPGKRGEFYEALCRSGLPEASRAESGNIKYDYFLSAASNTGLLLIEKWRDAESFEAHKNTPHFKKLQGMKEEYTISSTLEIFEA